MARYLLDTDTCIAFLKGKHNLLEKVETAGYENCFISEVTLCELLYGAYYSDKAEKHLRNAEKAKEIFTVIPISEAIDHFAKEKAKLRRNGRLIHDFDLLIGATSVHFDMVMVTGNVKHLSRISGIRIENWMRKSQKAADL